MDKATMERLGIVPVKKMRNNIKDDLETILINKHSDGAISVGYARSVAELVIGGSVHEKYIQFGWSADDRRLYMWGDAEGFAVSLNKASSNKCYTSAKSLATVLPEVGYPFRSKLEFDPLAKCYFVRLKEEQ